MRIWPIALALFAGSVSAGSLELPMTVQNVLTLIDAVPLPSQLDSAFCSPAPCTDHGAASQGLATIATDNGAIDAPSRNARLHAISALASYCTAPCNVSDPAHQALVSIITSFQGESTGFDAVLLRAAIEAIGPQRATVIGSGSGSGSNDDPQPDLHLLLDQLQNPSRDIRTAAAHALRDLCNTNAIAPLRQQQQNETSDQVKQAITEALRVLGQAPC